MKSTTYKQKPYSRGSVLIPPPKPTPEEQEYWEQVLHDHGLGLHRGEKIGSNKITYGWNEDRSTDVEPTEDDYSEESRP